MEARTATGDLSCAADTGPAYIPGATQQQRDAPSPPVPLLPSLPFHNPRNLSIRSRRRAS